MKIVAILQARMHSTRLPGKMLLPLAGTPLVQRVIERVRRATRLDDVVLAVPSRDAADFAPICNNSRAWLYSSPLDESDLIGRYLRAADAHDADVIVRIPCDNPCVDPFWIDQAIIRYLQGTSLFVSTTTGTPDGQHYLDGIGAEVFSSNQLQLVDRLTRGLPRYREHPHLWFYEHTDWHDPSTGHNPLYPVIRLDVNTQADYAFIAELYEHCYAIRTDFDSDDILRYLVTNGVAV